MTLPTFPELFEKLSTSDESVEIEAKKASEVAKRVLETGYSRKLGLSASP